MSEFYGDHWNNHCAVCKRGFPHPRRDNKGFVVCPECIDKINNSPELVCPECGYFPLTLSGEHKGLDLKITDGKAECPNCSYEEEFGE